MVQGHRVPVIGLVSTHHMMIDLTNFEGVQVAAIITLVGTDCDETIRIENVAVKIGTVSDDILSTLGTKLKRIKI